MKKLFVIGLMLMMCVSLTAQSVHIFKSGAVSVRMYSSDINTYEHWCDPIKTDVTIRIDLEKKYITITEIKYVSIKILDLIEEKSGELTKDGDPYKSFLFSAIDKQSRELKVFIQSFESGALILSLMYDKDVQFQYQAIKTSYTSQLQYTNN